jgi:signal transduction histidine kinase
MHSVQVRILTVRSARSKPDAVRVSVEDTGAGIEAGHADSVFKPLFTTKTHGTGMGLAICRSIIETHGGRIWVSPGTESGSIFQFELPVNAGP